MTITDDFRAVGAYQRRRFPPVDELSPVYMLSRAATNLGIRVSRVGPLALLRWGKAIAGSSGSSPVAMAQDSSTWSGMWSGAALMHCCTLAGKGQCMSLEKYMHSKMLGCMLGAGRIWLHEGSQPAGTDTLTWHMMDSANFP